MTRGWLLTLVLGSSLVGGVAGASVARLAGPPAVRDEPAAPASRSVGKVDRPELDDEDELASRLEALETAVRSLQRRDPAQLRALAASASSTGPNVARPNEAKSLVDDPIFEAAVTDVMQRVAEQQATERQSQREERQQQRQDRWATELSARLALTPDQRTSVLEIRTSMQAEMQRAFEADAGASQSREQRRARAREIQAEAEAKLSAALSGRQLAEYQKLDPELKLSRESRTRPGVDSTSR